MWIAGLDIWLEFKYQLTRPVSALQYTRCKKRKHSDYAGTLPDAHTKPPPAAAKEHPRNQAKLVGRNKKTKQHSANETTKS